MKNKFIEYHLRDKENFDKLLKDSIIVLDTNALLNLYRYNETNRNKFFEILGKVKTRLFLPYQVCKEFYKNRDEIIFSKSNFKVKLFEFFEEELKKVRHIIENSNCTIDKYSKFISLLKHEEGMRNELLQAFDQSLVNYKSIIEKSDNEISQEFIHRKDKDKILINILNIFEGKVSDKLKDEELEKIYKEGAQRYEKNIPPGFKDKSKPDPDKYGDLIIWKEIIEISKSNKKDILFVSDDRKEDCVENIHGFDLGPKKEMIREFKKETEFLFYSVTNSDFIKKISELHSIKETESLEQEAKLFQDYHIEHLFENDLITSHGEINLDKCIKCPKFDNCEILKKLNRNKDINQEIINENYISDYEKDRYLTEQEKILNSRDIFIQLQEIEKNIIDSEMNYEHLKMKKKEYSKKFENKNEMPLNIRNEYTFIVEEMENLRNRLNSLKFERKILRERIDNFESSLHKNIIHRRKI